MSLDCTRYLAVVDIRRLSMRCILQTLQEVNTVNNILEVIGNTEQSKRAAEVSWIKRGVLEGEERKGSTRGRGGWRNWRLLFCDVFVLLLLFF